MSYAAWIRRGHRHNFQDPVEIARRYFGLEGADSPREESPWPVHFERFCVEHDEKLNWLLCPKGHQLTGAEDWIVKDVRTGEVIAKCRENDGTQSWRGPAPR